MELLRNELSLKRMKFVADDLDREFRMLLETTGFDTLNISNAKDAYIVILEKCQGQNLDFSYS